jgi:hypothetical protein
VDNKSLKQLLRTLRDHGVTEYTTPELALKLEPGIPTEQSVGPSPQAIAEAILGDGDPSAEQLMNYSSMSPIDQVS